MLLTKAAETTKAETVSIFRMVDPCDVHGGTISFSQLPYSKDLRNQKNMSRLSVILIGTPRARAGGMPVECLCYRGMAITKRQCGPALAERKSGLL
jgi:hypothetical protein